MGVAYSQIMDLDHLDLQIMKEFFFRPLRPEKRSARFSINDSKVPFHAGQSSKVLFACNLKKPSERKDARKFFFVFFFF